MKDKPQIMRISLGDQRCDVTLASKQDASRLAHWLQSQNLGFGCVWADAPNEQE